MESNRRDGFQSNLGTILALAGSAVGLGNIWRFPYMVAENGGSAFIIVYILMVFVLCIPAFLSEFSIGRNSKSNVFGAFRKLAPNTKWPLVGLLGVVATFLISSYYTVIGGWTLSFLYNSAVDTFNDMSPDQVALYFENFVGDAALGSFWTLGFTLISILILVMGVGKGIERYNKILMPVLLIILVVMGVNSLTLDGGEDGIAFVFHPDFSKITFDVVLSAMGQAFFSMSLGLGAIITYGSYARKQDSAMTSSLSVAAIGIIVSILASIVIFPAVYAYDIPAEEGATLAYVTFPAIFQRMPGGDFFGVVFFVLLLVAAMTSVISIFEVITAFLVEEFKMGRKKALLIITVSITLTSTMCAYSLTKGSALMVGSKTLFDFLDYLTASYLLPLGGLLISIFAGRIWNKDKLYNELSSDGKYRTSYFSIYLFMIRYIIPIMVMMIFLGQLM